MIVKFKKLNERAVMPTKGSEYSAGADLYSAEPTSITVKPGETVFIGTGLAVEIPKGYAGLVYARSGIACKRGLAPANKVGVIDADYRGEVCVPVVNLSAEEYTIQPQERIAQMVICKVEKADITVTEELCETERGCGGFGSTGKN